MIIKNYLFVKVVIFYLYIGIDKNSKKHLYQVISAQKALIWSKCANIPKSRYCKIIVSFCVIFIFKNVDFPIKKHISGAKCAKL